MHLYLLISVTHSGTASHIGRHHLRIEFGHIVASTHRLFSHYTYSNDAVCLVLADCVVGLEDAWHALGFFIWTHLYLKNRQLSLVLETLTVVHSFSENIDDNPDSMKWRSENKKRTTYTRLHHSVMHCRHCIFINAGTSCNY